MSIIKMTSKLLSRENLVITNTLKIVHTVLQSPPMVKMKRREGYKLCTSHTVLLCDKTSCSTLNADLQQPSISPAQVGETFTHCWNKMILWWWGWAGLSLRDHDATRQPRITVPKRDWQQDRDETLYRGSCPLRDLLPQPSISLRGLRSGPWISMIESFLFLTDPLGSG